MNDIRGFFPLVLFLGRCVLFSGFRKKSKATCPAAPLKRRKGAGARGGGGGEIREGFSGKVCWS